MRQPISFSENVPVEVNTLPQVSVRIAGKKGWERYNAWQ
jgi:hypothetical protein